MAEIKDSAPSDEAGRIAYAPIRVGAIAACAIPDEGGGDDDYGEDIDISSDIRPGPRKPEEFEPASIYPKHGMIAKLIRFRDGAGGMDSSYYYAEPSIRAELGRIRAYQIICWWSHRDRRWFLWPVAVQEGGSYYESVQVILNKPAEFRAESRQLGTILATEVQTRGKGL